MLYWASLHRDMGEAAMSALGPEATLTPYGTADNFHGDAAHDEMEAAHRLFFFTRSDTLYGGSNEIQRNVIGERALGLPANLGRPPGSPRRQTASQQPVRVPPD
ncbi:MAG: acyl-CoA dehydrogenase family protein [Microthrixaceae bacterium]